MRRATASGGDRMTVVEVVLGSGDGRRLVLRADSADREPYWRYDATLTVPGGSMTRHVDERGTSLPRLAAEVAALVGDRSDD